MISISPTIFKGEEYSTEIASSQDAQRAIAELNDSDIGGRLIFVREDREGGAFPSNLFQHFLILHVLCEGSFD